MADAKLDQEVPPRVMDLLRMFLAASSRGEQAVLVLETRNSTLTSKYKSVETVTGAPVKKVPSTLPTRKVNPARRSRARLEEFSKKKVAEKENAAGDITTSGTANRLILQLAKAKDKPVETRHASQILQLDGTAKDEVIQVKDEPITFFSFKSKYSEEDIIISLREIWPDAEATSTLVLRDRLGDHTLDHLCTLKVQSAIKNLSGLK